MQSSTRRVTTISILGGIVAMLLTWSAEATLVINEIDYDQPGTDRAEFIELLNPGPTPVNLGAYRVELINGSDLRTYRSIRLPELALPAGRYYVICGDPANVPNCNLDATPDSNLIQNGAPDAATLMFETAIVDSVSYEGDTGGRYTEGSGAGLTDDPGLDFAGISRLPNGIDTNRNNVDFSLRCITPGAPNRAENTTCAPAAATIPEPATIVLLGVGLAGMGRALRFRLAKGRRQDACPRFNLQPSRGDSVLCGG